MVFRKQKPQRLTDEELQVLLEKARKVQVYPNSTRCFEELFQEAYEILSTYGRTENWFLNRRFYTDHSRKESTITITYRRKREQDALILICGRANPTILGLMRERGNLSRRRYSGMDALTMYMKGIGASDVFKGLRSYEPDFLIIEKNGSKDITWY
jgi:hypothetical protein